MGATAKGGAPGETKLGKTGLGAAHRPPNNPLLAARPTLDVTVVNQKLPQQENASDLERFP